MFGGWYEFLWLGYGRVGQFVGYIGEDGLEIVLLVIEVVFFFNDLVGVGLLSSG